MAPSHAVRSVALVAATALLLAACEDLLPGQRQASPSAVVATETTRAATRRPVAREAAAAGPETDAAFRDINGSLRRLVAAEQGFYAENGTYIRDLERLGFRVQGESRIDFLSLTKDGWAARGSHPALPGRDCVIYVGAVDVVPATRRFGRTGREGVVACDIAAPPARPRATTPQPADTSRVALDTTSALDALSPVLQMRVDLRKMVDAQAAYFGTQGMYSRQVERLPLQFGWQRGVTVTLLHADRRSWSARATHTARPGKSCTVWYGTSDRRPATQAQQKVPRRSGVPACDD